MLASDRTACVDDGTPLKESVHQVVVQAQGFSSPPELGFHPVHGANAERRHVHCDGPLAVVLARVERDGAALVQVQFDRVDVSDGVLRVAVVWQPLSSSVPP